MRSASLSASLVAVLVNCGYMASAASAQEEYRPSVVKILATRRGPDLVRPWTKQSPRQVSGSGLVIDGKRILTNAHVVGYTTEVYVQGFQSADKIAAKVLAAAQGVDLAVLSVDDESFFANRLG
ncbi:MAG: trypsin-like peptidase domain-containing protein [Phycisphaerae bacterium]|nr:trypsin-like peptidase domain-containing protein [Phycisphaerae bacterium]